IVFRFCRFRFLRRQFGRECLQVRENSLGVFVRQILRRLDGPAKKFLNLDQCVFLVFLVLFVEKHDGVRHFLLCWRKRRFERGNGVRLGRRLDMFFAGLGDLLRPFVHFVRRERGGGLRGGLFG